MATFNRGLMMARSSAKCLQQAVIKQCHVFPPCRAVLQVSSTDRPFSFSSLICSSMFHTSPQQSSYRNTEFEDKPLTKIGRAKLVPPNWTKYNEVVYKPTLPGEQERPAIRGMSIDEAIKQTAFHKRKGAAHIKEVLEEAQEMAVRDHNVEFKSNMWISDSFCTRGIIVKGLRRHARARHGIIQYRYTNYFLRLREGKPPKDYYPPEMTGNELMENYIKKQRERRILYGL